ADHYLHPLAHTRLDQRVDRALHPGHRRRHQRGDADDVRVVLLHGGHELFGRHVPAEVYDLEAGALEHHGHQILADVVQVALRGTDHDDAVVVTAAGGGGDERLEQVEPRIHRARGEQHLRHVVLVAAEFLADDVHARNEAL